MDHLIAVRFELDRTLLSHVVIAFVLPMDGLEISVELGLPEAYEVCHLAVGEDVFGDSRRLKEACIKTMGKDPAICEVHVFHLRR